MDLEQQFPKSFYDFDTKCVSIWVHQYGHKKNLKNSKKVATYQGFMRILSVFSIISAYLILIHPNYTLITPYFFLGTHAKT